MTEGVRAIVIKDGALLVMKRNKFGQQFYSLVGGHIDAGETPEQALQREVQEESSIVVDNLQLVMTQAANDTFGKQYVYLCDYISGEPVLAADSFEAQATSQGENTYQPLWLKVEELSQTNLLPAELKLQLLDGLKNGFPQEPSTLIIKP